MGANLTLSLSSRMFSIPRLLAASISRTSLEIPWVISEQELHSLQGSLSIGFRQFNRFARILAIVVLPTPLGPKKIYAWPIFSGFKSVLKSAYGKVLMNYVPKFLRAIFPRKDFVSSCHNTESEKPGFEPGVLLAHMLSKHAQ